jgi:hypothetical protein
MRAAAILPSVVLHTRGWGVESPEAHVLAHLVFAAFSGGAPYLGGGALQLVPSAHRPHRLAPSPSEPNS